MAIHVDSLCNRCAAERAYDMLAALRIVPEGLGQMPKVARLLMRGTVLLVGLFVLCFLFALAFLIFVPLALERAAGFDASLPFGLWSQVRLAAIVGAGLAGLGLLTLLERRLESPKRPAHHAHPRERSRPR
jgi:hypothetical protein